MKRLPLVALFSSFFLAACGGGGGTSSSPGTTSPTLSAPGAPTAVRATATTLSIEMSFSPPQSDGGSPITAYDARCSAGSQVVSRSGASSPLLLDTLDANVQYSCTVSATNKIGTGPLSAAVTATPLSQGNSAKFSGNLVLGAPTATRVRANIYSTTHEGRLRLTWGTSPGAYTALSADANITPGQPIEMEMSGLAANTRYYYQLIYRATNGATEERSEEASFHTARPAGSAFTFSLQGDSHPERERSQFDSALYLRTLQAAAADTPDFYLLMGDDFSVDTLDAKTITAEQVSGRYSLQRPWLGVIGRQAPLFLVNGNHEQAARYLLDGTANNVAVWAQNARNRFYPQPAPDGFYTGNEEAVPHIGLLRNYFAWTWGDALFVVIDPYWHSPVAVDNVFGGDKPNLSMWEITHGEAQYKWLKTTLESSNAKYKFVFAHHVMGTGRGGIELARRWEWGGENTKGENEFARMRAGWEKPLHQLMADNKVTIFFQGHDHIWARQSLDGVTYQTLSEPADPNYTLWNANAYLSGDRLPNSGYTRVTVSPNGVRVDYIRIWLPADEGPGKTSGQVAFSYTLP